MFLGGANHEATRIRESSIKGALAFWWRALNYARFVEAAGGNQTNALRAMQAEEQALFGGLDGQGAFLLKVVQENTNTISKGQVLKEGNNANTVGVGARYLGYGLMGAFGKNTGRLERSCIKSGQCFSLQIIFKPLCQQTVMNEILQTIKLFGLLGGLGSRVRRGWGSVALKSIHELDDNNTKQEPALWAAPENVEAYKRVIHDIFEENPSRNASGTDWPLTAFANESRICVTDASDGHSLDHLNRVGEAMQKYRAWGFSNNGQITPPTVNGQDSEMNFEDDHDWSKGTLGRAGFVPERIAFGLPQNYKDNAGVTGKQVENKEQCINRRASPLAIHIHKTKNNQSFATLVLLPTKFLPADIVSANNNEQTYEFHSTGLPVLEHFLNQNAPLSSAKNPYKNGPYLSLSEINLQGETP